MFHPTLDPRGLSDQELDSRIKETVNKINQASRMQNENLYNQCHMDHQYFHHHKEIKKR